MDIPITGVLLIPLGLVFALLPWRWCLVGLMVFSMMPAAAVINAGGLGLQPGYYMAVLIVGRTAVEIMLRGFRLNAIVLARMWPLFGFLAAALVALFIGLSFFQGSVETLPGSSGFKTVASRPFQFAKENFAQLAYLSLNITLVYAMGHQAVCRSIRELSTDWDRAIVAAQCFSMLVCLWQFAGLYGGTFFPAEFFYSNAAYGRAEGQSMAGLFRINGPFGEPSALGYQFTGFVMFAIARLQTHFTPFGVLILATGVLCILISTSTTAFAGLLFCTFFLLYDIAKGRHPLLTRGPGIRPAHVAAIAVILVSAVVCTAVVLTNLPAIEVIVHNTILDKDQSTSFQQRSVADAMALDIFAETLGLGLGLGSHKANNLFFTLLANSGIAGVAFFTYFVVTLFLPVRTGLGRAESLEWERTLLPFRRALFGMIMIHLVSAPNLSVLSLWAQIGGLIALKTCLSVSTARIRAAKPEPEYRAVIKA